MNTEFQMLSCGINRSLLGSLTDELMQTACGITNPIHRLKMTQAFQSEWFSTLAWWLNLAVWGGGLDWL